MWIFNQTAGECLFNGIFAGYAYSGHGEGKNNHALENVKGVGPLPCGNFEIVGPPFTSEKTGKYVLRLVPDAETRARILAMGRDPDSFEWHGDSWKHPGCASDGCLVSWPGLRSRAWGSGDRQLNVISGIGIANSQIQI